MEWLNYHHLRYFWAVAKEGTLARAAATLRVSQPSISEQIHELESALGEKLFRREGRNNRLTEAGQLVLGYAEEIFSLGREMTSAMKSRPDAKTLRLHVGVVDSFPKLVANILLQPVFGMVDRVHVACREGKMDELQIQLAAHRLDIVLSDQPSGGMGHVKTFHHSLGESGTTFSARRDVATGLARKFPLSLHGAPALLPTENTAFRRELESWFREKGIEPRIVAEFDDLALMEEVASGGLGFIAVPTVASEDARRRYGFRTIGNADECRTKFYAITAERRVAHPALAVIIKAASRWALGK